MKIQQFDLDIPLLNAIPWQDDASNLRKLIEAKKKWYDINYQKFWIDWEKDVFNLNTASDFGIIIWSLIAGLPLISFEGSPVDYPAFGFAPFGLNFDNSNFATPPGFTRNLTQEQQRQLILWRFVSIFTDCSLHDVNLGFKRIFNDGSYAIDHLNMKMTYQLKMKAPSIMRMIYEKSEILPRPAGVKANFNWENPI